MSAIADDAGLAWFESWARQRAADERRPLDPAQSRSYANIWRRWLRFAAVRGLELGQATPEDVAQFLESGRSPLAPQQRRPRPKHTTPLSPTARRRYWRTLQRIYGHAQERGWCTHNPTALDAPQRPGSEYTIGLVLDEALWQALPEHAAPGADALAIRDRALLLLAMDLALRPQELCGLRLEAVTQDLASDGNLLLSIDGPRAAQPRRLPASARASTALREWLAVRQHITAAATQPDAAGLAFLSRRRTPLRPQQLYVALSAIIERASLAMHGTMPPKLSPMVLRNTHLLRRLRAGEPADELARFAGYKDPSGFRGLLPHLRRA